MQLIGMLDSPYVRRTAISLKLLGIAFEHRPVSVFSTFEEFRGINPVVKAPTLVCDDGEVLMESTLILDYAESLVAGRARSLMPSDIGERRHHLRLIGLALAACDKSVQIVYEHNLRPPEKAHAPWLERVHGQLAAAYAALEDELKRRPLPVASDTLSQAALTSAVAWQFTNMLLPGTVDARTHAALESLSQRAERLPEFLAFPPA